MKLKESKAIILFRFHKDIEVAKERIKIIKHFNPNLPVHVLFGGKKEDYVLVQKEFDGIVEHAWFFL